ncbi:probable crossover junction endonuclease EME2 isoform X1 [Lynx rufus]|uniref:probable crossover junction endonuclease EME2 isoform X1 n=1 Tax=Lynx rufus TaxID=61384 RepID=UPI001F1231BC|nr:probable crossover junction endonuclease EME2 isoform X1 [Lynx rufus]XP_046953934.1 probable crossover junction endonuclease EME2 isoform X1 [Lynx rufus]XP_046953935.1 probable crossover junction endonuclease EME2 isoform X1 [Lynx rufus]
MSRGRNFLRAMVRAPPTGSRSAAAAGSGRCPAQRRPGSAGSQLEAGPAMSRTDAGRAGSSRRGGCLRRPPTWEVSDSDAEGPAGAEEGARVPGPAEERRAAAKALRPEQALRRVAVRVDPAVLEDAGAGILLEALSTLGCEYQVETQRLARSLRWTRAKPDSCPRTVPSEVRDAGEQDFLLLLEPEEFLQGVNQLTQTSGPPCSVPWISPEGSASPHVAVIGLDAYLWSHQPSNIHETRQPETAAVARTAVALSWPRVEEALVLLQLWAHLDVLLVASWQELSRHVCAFTKAFAQRPLKQYRESRAFSFCVAGRWAGGERVARDGTGLRGVWWRQIRQFNRVSPAVADAVVTAFPSPRLLQQAYRTCNTEQERTALLADLPVKTGDGARPRRVGPDLARRICLFLTTTSPELLLDLGS